MIKYDWQADIGLRVPKLSTVLESTAQTLWPEQVLPALFYPLSDSARGEIGTDFTQQLARLIKISVKEVTTRLLKEMPQVGTQLFCIYDGYLNIQSSLELNSLLASEFKVKSDTLSSNKFDIVLPTPNSRCFGESYLRLFSLALLHRRMLGSIFSLPRLFIGEIEIISGQENCNASHWLKVIELLNQPVGSESASTEALFSFLMTADLKRVFLWGFDENLTRKQFVQIRERVDLIFNFPKRGWLYGEDFGDGIAQYQKHQELLSHHSVPLEFYLAGDIRFTDVDLFVPTSAERANLVWYIQATVDRLRTILEQSSDDKTGELSLQEDPLLRKALLLDWLSCHLATTGQIWDFLDYLTKILDQLNQKLNDPIFRRRIISEGMLETSNLLTVLEIMEQVGGKLKILTHCLGLNGVN